VNTDVLEGWRQGTFTAAGLTRSTFRRGVGPAVIVIHEIPGITPKVIEFANDVVDRGLTAVLPSLVGRPGKPPSKLYEASSIVRICVAEEFTTWALNRTSPVVAWLRALAKATHAEVGGPGVGAVGMCFSGGFVLGMMLDDVVIAPVASQPSMPFALGRAERKASVGLADNDFARVAERSKDGCNVLGLRFLDDKLVGSRFETLRSALGDSFIAIELPSAHRRDHSVLTEHRDEPAVTKALDFLQSKLLAS
jgi:dienelactone hydrolase